MYPFKLVILQNIQFGF